MGFSVVVRDGTIYNDVTSRTGKIFHVKSVGRRASKMFFYKIFAFCLYYMPGLVRNLVRLNRKYRLWVWKPRA